MRKVKVAATQMALTWNLKENIEKAHQKVKEVQPFYDEQNR